MKLRTGHRRKLHKLFGKSLPVPTVKRIAICNRFAASSEGRSTKVGRKPQGYVDLREYFPDVFYSLKDRLMDRYGKPKGLALQHWTSGWEDYDDDRYVKDACSHSHILERVKLGPLMLHRPTGHFSFYNSCSDYWKKTVGFDVIAATCVEKLEGKKRITRNIPDREQALAALEWLLRRYSGLMAIPSKPKERPRVRSGDYYTDLWEEHQSNQRTEFDASDVQCHWCHKVNKGADVTFMDGHYFCQKCTPLIAASMRNANAAEIEADIAADIPF